MMRGAIDTNSHEHAGCNKSSLYVACMQIKEPSFCPGFHTSGHERAGQ